MSVSNCRATAQDLAGKFMFFSSFSKLFIHSYQVKFWRSTTIGCVWRNVTLYKVLLLIMLHCLHTCWKSKQNLNYFCRKSAKKISHFLCEKKSHILRFCKVYAHSMSALLVLWLQFKKPKKHMIWPALCLFHSPGLVKYVKTGEISN